MILIAKPGKDPSIPNSYRPITLLDLIGKAFGKLINRRFIAHMEVKGLFNPLQYGFRRGRGCESSLALMYEYAVRRKCEYKAEKVKVTIVSRDISGAFDRVWHQCLMRLFSKLGLPCLFVKLICNFLVGREVRIRIGRFVGQPFTPQAGVPQGAPDSPDLFNVSTLPMGDLPYTPNVYAPWYCDDLHIIIATVTRSYEMHKMKILTAIQNQDFFERTRGIITCPEKSKVTPFSYRPRDPIEYVQNDNLIVYNYLEANNSTKILGLNITSRSWTDRHTRVCSGRAKEIVNKLYSVNRIPKRARLHLFKTLVVTALTYPCTPLNACRRSGFARLQVAYNIGLRFVFQTRFPELVTAKSLHERAAVDPINLILYNRGKKTWDKIRDGVAGDVDTFSHLDSITINYPHTFFPSSLERARKDPPPPLFTISDSKKRSLKQYYDPP